MAKIRSDIADQAQKFAAELDNLIQGCLPNVEVRVRAAVLPDDHRVLIRPLDETTNTVDNPPTIPLYMGGEHLADFKMRISTVEDSTGTFLKTEHAEFALWPTWERTPLVRLEYDTDSTSPPLSHWQFHGERGALSFLLARAAATSKHVTKNPWSLSKLHFPVGGERFRPSIEDFLEFLIRECGFDAKPGWDKVLQAGRAKWRSIQLATLVRDQQEEVASTLRILGWEVSAPEGFVGQPNSNNKKW